MTLAEQREAALRLYRLAWRIPEQAPAPKCSGFGEDLYFLAGFIAYAPSMLSVSATCRKTGVCTVTIAVDDAQLHIQGTAEHVEAMLRAIPVELRPHVGRDQ